MLERRRNAAGGGLTPTPGDSRPQGTLADVADDLEVYLKVTPAASYLRAPVTRP